MWALPCPLPAPCWLSALCPRSPSQIVAQIWRSWLTGDVPVLTHQAIQSLPCESRLSAGTASKQTFATFRGKSSSPTIRPLSLAIRCVTSWLSIENSKAALVWLLTSSRVDWHSSWRRCCADSKLAISLPSIWPFQTLDRMRGPDCDSSRGRVNSKHTQHCMQLLPAYGSMRSIAPGMTSAPSSVISAPVRTFVLCRPNYMVEKRPKRGRCSGSRVAQGQPD
jgi:hypothetical protein